MPGESIAPIDETGRHGLIRVDPPPVGPARRSGLSTDLYRKRPPRDYAEQDAKNRKLGLAGEESGHRKRAGSPARRW
jgi:hypothetical protein